MDNIRKQNRLLFLLIAVMIVGTLFLKAGSEFEGADDQAEGVIEEIAPEYEAWAEPFWEPPSGEIESLLFSVQVAIGALFVGYGFGVLRERRKNALNR